MIDFTARQKFILNSIIEKGPLNIKDLSQEIDVSSRTISRELLIINNLLCDKEIMIHENNSILNITGEEEKIKHLKRSLGGIPLQWLLSQEQRMIFITAQLLMANEPYKSAYFSYQFNVVEGTISLYMDKIEQLLNLHNMSLSRKRGYGLIIDGSEWNKRNLFIELLYEYKPIDELLAFVYDNKIEPTINVFFKTIFDNELIKISKDLLKLISREIFNLDDIAYFSSFIHILLSLKETKLGFPINLPEYLVKDILSAKEFSFIHNIKKYLLTLNIDIIDDEMAYIAIHLMGNKYVYKVDGKFEELGVSLEDLALEVVYEVGKKLNTKIECDEQLIIGLSQHFSPALYRINMGIQIKNPIVEQIREYYGDLFKAVNYGCKIVFSKYNIIMPKDEIGYLTMHIGASIERNNVNKNVLSALIICQNGIGSAKILSSKIKTSIPSIGSVTISSFKDWTEENGNYDIILSTVNINHNQKSKNTNIITVSPFLQNEDIDKINDYIKTNLSYGNLFNNSKPLAIIPKTKELIKDKYDIINGILKNLQLKVFDTSLFSELVTLIIENIFDEKLISDKDEIRSLIINREEMGNVVIPNCHVALLHTRSDSVNNPFVGVYRIKNYMKLKSMGFAEENVDTFIVMLARKNEDNFVLEQIGKISISLIEDKNFTEILRLGDIKDLSSSLIKILNMEET
jgi:mannitol operon transcriptional antiterminator